jgi:GTP pyrophosphokinase
MIIANEFPLDDITIVSTLLHDIVEDTDFELDLLTKEFGKEVAEIVDGVTKIGGIFKGQWKYMLPLLTGLVWVE